VSQGVGQVTVGPTADPVVAGGHVMVRPPGGAPYVARVESVTNLTGGNRRLALTSAELPAAFDDYTARYVGHATEPVATTASGAAEPGVDGFPTPSDVGLTFFEGRYWSCSESGESVDPGQILDFSVEYSGDVNLDVSLSERRLDFSVKGGIEATLTISNLTSVWCTLDADLPIPQIPIGATGLTIKFGGTGTLSLSRDADKQGSVTLTGATRIYAALWYDDGATVRDASMGTSGVITMRVEGIAARIDLGVNIEVGPAEVPGLEDIVDAQGSITFGLGYQIARPMSPLGSDFQYRGPSCYDGTNAPFVAVGLAVLAPFFPDVSVDVARKDFAPATFYKGPCYGYTGTITHTEKIDDTINCQPEGCSVYRHDRSLTITLTPGVGQFSAGQLHQPFTWQGHVNNYYANVDGLWWGCWRTEVGDAVGSKDWSAVNGQWVW
jgi:hypothetical protein